MIFLVSKAHFVTYTQYVYDMDQIANKIKWKIIIKNMIQYMPSFYFRTTDFHTRNVLQHKRTKTPLVVCYVVFFFTFLSLFLFFCSLVLFVSICARDYSVQFHLMRISQSTIWFFIERHHFILFSSSSLFRFFFFSSTASRRNVY